MGVAGRSTTNSGCGAPKAFSPAARQRRIQSSCLGALSAPIWIAAVVATLRRVPVPSTNSQSSIGNWPCGTGWRRAWEWASGGTTGRHRTLLIAHRWQLAARIAQSKPKLVRVLHGPATSIRSTQDFAIAGNDSLAEKAKRGASGRAPFFMLQRSQNQGLVVVMNVDTMWRRGQILPDYGKFIRAFARHASFVSLSSDTQVRFSNCNSGIVFKTR